MHAQRSHHLHKQLIRHMDREGSQILARIRAAHQQLDSKCPCRLETLSPQNRQKTFPQP